jgi:Flp pilus assembly protein TadB
VSFPAACEIRHCALRGGNLRNDPNAYNVWKTGVEWSASHWRRIAMKNVALLIVALLVGFFIYTLVIKLVSSIIGIAITIAMILFFCWLVSTIYKALTKQKSIL